MWGKREGWKGRKRRTNGVKNRNVVRREERKRKGERDRKEGE